MSNLHGKFVWYDVMTSDTKAAESFYHHAIGWDVKNSGMPDRSYTLLSAGPTMVGGLMPIPESARAMGVRPCWMGYIAVDDVDACAVRVKAARGAVHRAPEDIPGVGRFAVVSDPHGAGFMLFKGATDQEPAPAAPGTPGHIGWRELHAGDGESDFAFYSGLFGWTKAEAFDMGPMGVYQLFAAGGGPCGGMMTKTPEMPVPMWLYYFNVDDINAAVARVKDKGGELLMGPHEVPGGSWIAQCRDPQGAMFAMIKCAPGLGTLSQTWYEPDLVNVELIMRGLDPRNHLSTVSRVLEDGLRGQARQRRYGLVMANDGWYDVVPGVIPPSME